MRSVGRIEDMRMLIKKIKVTDWLVNNTRRKEIVKENRKIEKRVEELKKSII